MKAYYNEIDKHAAAWLRQLITDGLIAPGDVDERDIKDVTPDDIRHYTQCHFFAGIGGWALALRLAGWPDNRPVWTGSCPCQPFSSAGKQLGTTDARHLWPVFRELIRAGKPSIALGEQVASKVGREWLAGVFADLEGMDYQRAGADLCAAGIGSPHIRQRLFWVAYAEPLRTWGGIGQERTTEGGRHRLAIDGVARRLADNSNIGRGSWGGRGAGVETSQRSESSVNAKQVRSDSRMADAASYSGPQYVGEPGIGPRRQAGPHHGAERGGDSCGLGIAIDSRLEGHAGYGDNGNKSGRIDADQARPVAETGGVDWTASRWHLCSDGKHRRVPVEPALFPLAHGLPGRVGLLRGAGNAIVPQVAAAFIEAVMEVAHV